MINLLRRNFFGSQNSKEEEKRNKACEKGIANEKNGQHFNQFFLPNPFGNWGSKGVIYFSLVKLLIESKTSAGGAYERPSNV